ncbi:MAG: hypothetical protein E6H73_06465 [Betaproteobacteria bacterium]|nr:MAG: hypothetical protein E6H73_06465 [Betaproteobacteria bacterium]
MTTDTAPDFDLGPLTWVQGEIGQALSRGLDALALFKASPHEITSLKHARSHVHQAAGAIQMVGLDAVTAYTDELERQLSRLEELAPQEAQEACDLIDRACRKLKIFLDELVGGADPMPLKLFPEYELMQQARGIKASAPTDLFYPDLSPRAPKIASVKTVASQKLPSFLIKQRRLYQRGLLAWLHGDEEAAREMRDAIQGIEDVQTHSSQRSFWWTVGALLESIVEKGVESGFGVKQLCGRVDLQIRRFVEGSAKVADRMRREVLYYVAISAPVGPQVQAVQRAYRLPGLIPSAEVLSADVVRVQPLLREARELLSSTKDLWLKLTGGRPENLPKLKQNLSQLRDKTAAIGEPSLSRLASTLASRLDKMGTTAVPEAMAMEYATAILLAESAIENFASHSPDFPKQVEAMIARLDAAQQNKPITGAVSAPLLDEMARRAQERLLLAQVAREIQANLRHLEQVLDAFFRDHSKRAELATLAHDSKQIAGALKMLGLDRAEQLLTLCQQQIDEYVNPDTPVENEDLELLAESLSGLGFYIEAVEQQRPDRDRLIEPLLAQRLGIAPTAPAAEEDTLESAVADLQVGLPATLAAFQRAPGDAPARERLAVDLTTLKDDAKLLGDVRLEEGADAALAELLHAPMGDTAALREAVAAISSTGSAEPAPAPSEETMRLLETDASQFDAELLDIYLTEADEVLDAIASSAVELHARPDDREALTTIRRGFHTLKGSGRMVGLTELGDLAFEVEKAHNRLLEDDRPATPAMLALIKVAQTSFREWLNTLRQTGRVKPDPAPLRAALAEAETELPHPQLSALPGAQQPSPAPARLSQAANMISAAIEVIELDDTALPHIERPAGDSMPVFDSAEIIQFKPIATVHSLRSAVEPVRAPAEPDEITVGDVTLSTALFRILCDEAQQHLATLDAELTALQFDSSATPSQAMVRAAHTLCGIHRTGGFPLVATVSKALEACLLGLQERGAPLPGAAQPVLAHAIAGLTVISGRVRTRDGFRPADEAEGAEIIVALDALRQETGPQPEDRNSETFAARGADADETIPPRPRPVASTPPPVEAPRPERPARATADRPILTAVVPSAAAERSPPPSSAPRPAAPAAATAKRASAAAETLANIHDDVDRQVLPIFLEEAAELFPQTGEQLRAWRRKPADKDASQALQRTLHTFKGSARMAGAMRLGELAHLMESRLSSGDVLMLASPELFDALDNDLDHVAFVLDRLQKGEFDTVLPWIGEETAAEAAATVETSMASPAIPTIVSVLPVATRPTHLAEVVAAAAGVEPAGADTEARAMLRVRADLIDRLVNEAGEVAITRTRAEGELRSLKGNLLELTGSVIRLRSQVREIEIQAESQTTRRRKTSIPWSSTATRDSRS